MHGNETCDPNSGSNLGGSWSIWVNPQSDNGYNINRTTNNLHSTVGVSWDTTVIRPPSRQERIRRTWQWAIVSFSFIGMAATAIGVVLHQSGVLT